ncbi:MAG: phosphatidate cytidylyltransferase [Paracoccaceae bacterium]
MTGPGGTPAPGRWSDLRTRMTSAGVMLGVGALEIWLGGPSFIALVVLLTAVMIWELSMVTAPAQRLAAVALAVLAAASLLIAVGVPPGFPMGVLLLPALGLALTPRRDKRIAAGFGAAVLAAGYGLITLRLLEGGDVILWLVGIVVVSDVLGYFAGRLIGGPKFWPQISPKKTWSGTVAGWLGASLVGLGFVLAGEAGWVIVALSPVVALAGQMGDIAESWIKRRAGVKDASQLIPGHGGVMDRFDAMTGAVVAVLLISLAVDLPFGEV